jgi:RNA polymerase sigma-70 factor (ECF subfamily)
MKKDTSYRELSEKFIQSRSEKDYIALYKKVKPGLRSYILNVVKDKDATEDILVNTLTKMWTKIDQYDPQYQITTWLYRIAFNESLGWIRQRNRKYSIDGMREYGVEITESNNLSHSAQDLLIEYHSMSEQDYLDEETDLMQQYASALESIQDLQPLYRGIIEDRLLNHMKYEDISEKYNLPLQTIKNRIRRGKTLIAENMKKNVNS